MLRGDAGIGKTVLLEWAAGQAHDMQVARVAGIQAETGMGFAGLHQLLVPFLGGLDGLPGPQRQALESAFGLVAGPVPDRFLVGLAALTLLTDAAAAQPVLCLVDDAQWLDQVSVEVLGFVARRLYADRVGMLFTVREGQATALAGLPQVVLGGLPAGAAGELLAISADARVDGRVSAEVVAGVAGNPLALVELAGELTAEELSGAVPLSWPLRFGGQLEELYLARVQALPVDTQTLLAVAAADPTGDPALVAKAAGQLGTGLEACEAAEIQRLVSWQPRVRFRHPLIRSAAYYAAPEGTRRRAHAALAGVTDPDADPDRRAWHLAEAAPEPDEDVAAELDRSASRAQARGGLAAAAAFLERAADLTPDPRRRAERTLAAAQASLQAGGFGKARDLMALAEAGPMDEFQAARADLLRGRIAFASGLGSDAPPLLLKAAKRFEPLNLDLARETYLGAWMAALFAGRLGGPVGLLEVSRAARALPPLAHAARPVDLILDGLAQLVTEGPATAAHKLRQAARAFAGADITMEERLRWGSIAHAAASAVWDDDAWRDLLTQQVRLARTAGALDQLPVDLGALAMSAAWSGNFATAAALITESDAVCEATGSRAAPYAAMLLACLRGDHAGAIPVIETTITEATAGGQGLAVTYAHWTAAILYNGLGRYDEALAAARQASEDTPGLYVSMWALPELIEAAARSGNTDTAGDALAQLTETTQASGTDVGLGLEARSRALVSGPQAAETLYREAIDWLGRTQLRPELARAHLVYGEWLRREHRRTDARAQLRTAHEMLDAMGMAAFAERAGRELQATGETIRKRAAEAPSALTAQEFHIARLARDGRTNPEIGAQLFLSTRTVEWHLSHVFVKLGIGSRRELRAALPPHSQDRQPA